MLDIPSLTLLLHIFTLIDSDVNINSLVQSYGFTPFSKEKFVATLLSACDHINTHERPGFKIHVVPIHLPTTGCSEDVILMETPYGYYGPQISSQDSSVIGRDLFSFFNRA